MGQKQKDKTKSNGTRQKSKREDMEKWDQTGSPEVPVRGETDIPGLPSGAVSPRQDR